MVRRKSMNSQQNHQKHDQEHQNYQQRGEHENNHARDAGITDVIGSMMHLASASTRFTWKQMQNVMGMMVGSQSAMNNVRDSMENIKEAMSQNGNVSHKGSSGAMHANTEPQAADEAFSGRKV